MEKHTRLKQVLASGELDEIADEATFKEILAEVGIVQNKQGAKHTWPELPEKSFRLMPAGSNSRNGFLHK